MKRIPFILTLLMLGGCSASSILAPSGEPAKLYTLRAPQTVATSAAVAPLAALDCHAGCADGPKFRTYRSHAICGPHRLLRQRRLGGPAAGDAAGFAVAKL